MKLGEALFQWTATTRLWTFVVIGLSVVSLVMLLVSIGVAIGLGYCR